MRLPEWLRHTAASLSASETAQLACKDRPTIYQAALQPLEPHDLPSSSSIMSGASGRSSLPVGLKIILIPSLREGKAPGTINWDLIFFRDFCRFLIEEGYRCASVDPEAKAIGHSTPFTPSLVCRTSSPIGKLHSNGYHGSQKRPPMGISSQRSGLFLFAVALRAADQRSLLICWLIDIDMEARKLFIRNSKERKDRIVYISDTAAMAVQQHLAIRPDPGFCSSCLPTSRGVMHPRSLTKTPGSLSAAMWCPRDSSTSQTHFRQPDVGSWYAGDFSSTLSGPRTPGHHHDLC